MTSRRRVLGMERNLHYPDLLIRRHFFRRDDGIWCRRDAIGRLYPVNAYGDRCSKPKVFPTSSGKPYDQRRPEEVSSHVWWEMMNKGERRQWWRDHPDLRPASESLPSIQCHPLGIEALISNVPPITLMSLSSVEDRESDSSDEDMVDQPSKEERLFPWERWENTIRELTLLPATASVSTITDKTFRMPLSSSSEFSQQHRDLLGFRLCLDNLCVARPVGKHEIERTPAAKLAMKKEWDRLRSKNVWDEDHPRDWDEVRSDARRGGVYSSHGILSWYLRRKECGAGSFSS